MTRLFIWIKRPTTDYIIMNTQTLTVIATVETLESAIRTTAYLNVLLAERTL